MAEEVARLINILNLEEQKMATKNKAGGEELMELRKESNNLKVYIKNL